MNYIIYIIVYSIFIISLNYLLKIKNLIPNYSGNPHQKLFTNKKVQLSGGVFILPVLLFINIDQGIFFLLIIFLFFLLGLFSDLNLFSSAKWRFLVQSILIFLFLYNYEISISSLRAEYLDIALNNHIFNFFFTTFCLMILVNGTNFIDGLNGLVLTYYLIICLIIFKTGLIDFLPYENFEISILIISIIILILFNFFNQLYLGDSGSYLIGFFFGYFLLSIYENNQLFSPYFVALLLWYPAFEILFSIIRKLNLKKSPFNPDNNHLHHLLFFFIDKKFFLKKNYSNNLSSILIVFYNFLIFYISSININQTMFQVTLIMFNVGIYLFLYFKLSEFKKANN